MGNMDVVFSDPIKTETIRRTKNHPGVSFLAVNFGIVTGAFHWLPLEQNNMEIPAEFPIIFSVELSHPGGTNVSLYFHYK